MTQNDTPRAYVKGPHLFKRGAVYYARGGNLGHVGMSLRTTSRTEAEARLVALASGRFDDRSNSRVVKRPKRTGVPGVIYFIQASLGPVKVGWTIDVERRLIHMQTANFDALSLLFYTPGDFMAERGLHERLAPHRIRGEWYRPTAELFAVIDEMRRTGARLGVEAHAAVAPASDDEE